MNKKNNPQAEMEELDRAYADITGRKPKASNGSSGRSKGLVVICILLVLVLAGSLALLFSLQYSSAFDGVLRMQDVTVGSVALGGMTKEEAVAALEQMEKDTFGRNMTVTVMDSTLEIAPADIDLQLDAEALVKDVYDSRVTGEIELLPYLHMDTAALRSALDTLGAQYNTGLVQTVVGFKGTQPQLDLGTPPAEDGLVLTVTVGIPKYGLDTEALYQQVLEAYNNGTLRVTGQCSQLEPEMPDLEQLYAQTYVAPTDAVMDPETFRVTQGSYGYHFDLEAAKAQLAQAEYGQVLEFPFAPIAPAVTAEQLQSTLFCDVLGEAKTPYKGSDTNNRNTNLAIACDAIDGLVLLPGESFSYNDTLGERTADKGYKDAPSYVGGLTVDTLGGGICQVSSTLYYSTLFADLEILERHNHGYVSDYIEKGMDATVTWDGADLRFANNTNYPIRIEAWRIDGYVNVQILGTDERDYYIKMTYKVLESTPYDTVYEEMTKDNPKGYKDGDVIVTPYKGYVVRAYKEKYSKETDELISKEMESYNVYKKRDKVICKIVEAPATTEEP